MTSQQIAADAHAVAVARAIHRTAKPEQTIPFGSRARGDRRPDSYDVTHSPGDSVPGEKYRYLTEFGGAALHNHERLPPDNAGFAQDAPAAVAELRDTVEEAKRGQSYPFSGGSEV